MAVAFDASSATTGHNVSSVTFAHDPTGTDNLLAIVGAGTDLASFTTSTYNGVAMTAAGTGFTGYVRIYYSVGIPATSSNVVFGKTGSNDYVIQVSTFTGVHQTSPLGTVVTATQTANSPVTLNITGTSANNMVFSATQAYTGGQDTHSWTPGTGITERQDADPGFSGDSICGAIGDQASTAGTVTVEWTQVNWHTGDESYLQAVEIKEFTMDSGLVSYWRFDESSGAAADAVGGYNLTNENSVGYTTGKLFNCADFGTTAANKRLVRTGDIAGISTTRNSMSVSFWVKVQTEPTGDGIQDFFGMVFDNTSGWSFILRYYSGNGLGGGERSLRFAMNGNGTTNADELISLGTSNWHHIVATFDESDDGMVLYLDGTNVATGTAPALGNTTAAPSTMIAIGNEMYSSAFDALCYIDEVALWQRELTSAEVTSLYNSGSGMYFLDGAFTASADAKNNGLTHYWKMDEASGDAFDAHNSTDLTNNNTVAFAAAKINNGADIERGSTQSLSAADPPGMSSPSGMTFNFWYKPESLAEDYTIFSKRVTTGDQRSFQFQVSSTTSVLAGVASSLGTSATDKLITSNSGVLVAGEMHMYTCVINSSSSKIYKDGTDVTSSNGIDSATVFDSTALFRIGGDSPGNSYAWSDGLIDEFGVWTRALTGTEVSELYNSGTGKQYPFLASGPAGVKTWNGLAIASVKTIDGLAIGSIKKVKGLG